MRSRVSLFLISVFIALPALANGLDNAPPSFMNGDTKMIPIDISAVHINYVFNVETKVASAEATVKFHASEDGQPYFDMIPEPISGTLDGETLTKDDLATVSAPSKATTLRKIARDVNANTDHELIVKYNLKNSDLTWNSDSVRVGFFMSDLEDREYFEQYGPANYEFDQIKYSFSVQLTGTDAEHEIFTNGAVTSTEANRFTIEFPSYFTASSIFFHMTKKGYFKSNSYTYQGSAKAIPVTVYASSQSNVKEGVDETKKVLAELESTYGAFAHDRLVVYVTSSGGGMEYCGATMTSLWALSHELTHSWFARGVMPSNGNSGWIDEAIASWRDEDYPRADGAPSRSAVNLGGFSVYRRYTAQAAYSSGMTLISEFDYLNRNNGGMKAILKDLFARKQRQTISLDWFKGFMEESLKMDLTPIFNRYVLGRSGIDDEDFTAIAPEKFNVINNRHPRPFTKAELTNLR